MHCRGKPSFVRISRHWSVLVAGEEVAAQRLPPVEDHREATVDLAQAELVCPSPRAAR